MNKVRRIKIKKKPIEAYLARKYGITIEQYEVMRQKQCNKCAICHKEKPLVVDHMHSTGMVRQLICGICNSGLGMFKEDVVVMQSAIEYLKRHWERYHDSVVSADERLEEDLL